MTNGEKIKAIFPNAQIDEGMLEMHVWLDHEPAQFTKDWWNAEYKEPTTKDDLADDKTFYEQIVKYCNEHFLVLVEKDVWEDAKKALTTNNDLGVDCISRQAVLELIADYDLSMGQVVRGIHALHSVTPQEPKKGHWTHDGATVRCSNCGRGYKDAFGRTSAITYNFCPNCGADMREVEG